MKFKLSRSIIVALCEKALPKKIRARIPVVEKHSSTKKPERVKRRKPSFHFKYITKPENFGMAIICILYFFIMVYGMDYLRIGEIQKDYNRYIKLIKDIKKKDKNFISFYQ